MNIYTIRKLALSTGLLIASFPTFSIPAVHDITFERLWSQLVNEQKNDDPGVCPDFPNCPPPLAPEEDPTSDHADK